MSDGEVASRRSRPSRAAYRGRRSATLLGIRRRPVAFFGLAVLAAGAVVVAVVSPLLLRAAQESSLIAATPTSLLAGVLRYDTLTAPDEYTGRGAVTPSSLWRTAAPVKTTIATYPYRTAAPGSTTSGRIVSGHLLWSPSCAGVRITAGRCPTGEGVAAASTASGLPLGSTVRMTAGDSFRVVGLYAPRGGAPFTDPLMTGAVRALDRAHANDLVVDAPAVSTVSDGAWVTVVGVGPAHPLRLEDLPMVRRTLAQARADLEREATAQIDTPITQVLAVQQAIADAASLVALSLAAQTLAVAWAAQALLVGGIARARAGEWGVVRLRGFRLPRRLAAVFAEPVVAVLLGSVAGYALATLIARWIASATCGSAVQPLQPLALGIGGLAALGSLVALVLASVRSATLPLAQLLRERAEPRRIGRLALVAQSGAVLATALVVYSLLTGGQVTGPQLPLLAPALIAVTTGVLALRVAVPLLRRRLRPVPRSLPGLLVGRRVIRTPSLLATAVVLCVAVALSTASLQTWLTSDRLQQQRAQTVTGAVRVLEVRVPDGVDLLDAVRRADSTGRLAMAAVDLEDGAGPQRVVAVDTSRLDAVSSWDPQWGGMSAARLRRLLAPAVGPSLRLTGRQVEVEVTRTAMVPDGSGTQYVTPRDLQLSLTVQDPDGFRQVVLGRLDRTRFTGALPCASGCRIVDLAIENRGDDSGGWRARIGLVGLTTDQQAASETGALLRAASWRQQIDANDSLNDLPVVRIAQGEQGLALDVMSTQSHSINAIAPRDAPQLLPVLIGPTTRLSPVQGVQGARLGVGFGFESLLVRPVGRAAVLPRAVGDGVLADLGLVQRVSDPASSYGRTQVWLSAAAGSPVVAALERQGLRVIGQQSLARTESVFLAESVPRVALQGAAVGGAGLLLALLALLVSQLLRRPATRVTAQVLRAAGASPRTVRRIAFTGAVLPAVVGVVLGTLAGITGALLVLPTLPLGAGAGVLPPLDTAVFPVAVLAPAAAAIALSALIAATTSTGGPR